MTEIKLELPVKLNGVIITQDIIYELDYFQTEGCCNFPNPDFSNNGVKEYQNKIDMLTRTLIHTTVVESEDEIKRNLKQLLTELHFIHETIGKFAAPKPT